MFLPGFQGTAVMWLVDSVEINREFSTDACMIGAGGITEGEFFRVRFPPVILTKYTQIAHLELWSIIVAVKLWGGNFTSMIVKIQMDNEVVSQIINSGRSCDLLLQKLLRELYWWLAIHQFKVKSVHLAGKLNK